MNFHHLNVICFESSHSYFRKMSPSYVDRPNWHSDLHFPFAGYFLSFKFSFFFFFFFFFQCGWHIKTELKLKLNPLLRMSLNDNPFPWMKQYLYYLKTRAGSFSWALSCSTSFGKFFSIKTFPDEGIPSWVHSFSVEACFSSKTEFSDCITAWTWSNKKNNLIIIIITAEIIL